MAMAGAIDTPMLTTMHCLPTEDTRIVWERYTGAYNTVSRAQAAVMDGIRVPGTFVGHIYNSIDVESFPFSAGGGDDLLFLSRIAPEKGPHLAVEVARRTGRRLILAGKVDQYDQRFFDEVVRDLIDGDQIVFVGEADAQRKRELYANAYCLLLPLQWEEPFGLVMAEAMACGTPVIALRRGSAPELIAHGETGFVVDTVDEMADAVASVGTISRQACRDWVAHRFTPQIMASQYIQAYERIIENRRPPRVVVVAAERAASGPIIAGASELS
jgi:glycosyltransferase involved in cell wall biosynthesis